MADTGENPEPPRMATFSPGGDIRRRTRIEPSEQPVTYALVQHMIQTSEAKTEVKLNELRGHVDNLRNELSGELTSVSSSIQLELAKKPGTGAFIATVIGAAALVVGVLSFGGDRFDGGVQVSSISVQQAEEARALALRNAEQISELLAIIASQSSSPAPQSPQDNAVETQP